MRDPRCQREEGGLMRLGKKIIKALVFLVILLAVFVLLAFLTPKAM